MQFLALDVSASDLGDKAPTANTALITYKEEQAGYLAGYAAVYDGYKELGFLGGMAVPAVIRYATASCRALTPLPRRSALRMSTSSTGTLAASQLPMRSRTRWTVGTPRYRGRLCLWRSRLPELRRCCAGQRRQDDRR